MIESYPLPEGEFFSKLIYSDGPNYLIHTTNFQIVGLMRENNNKQIKIISDNFAYYKSLRRISSIFVKPLKLYIGSKDKKIHIQQVFEKYTDDQSKMDDIQLNNLLISSVKALSMVKNSSMIIQPLMTCYCDVKKKWHICVTQSKFEDIPAIPSWAFAICHIKLGSGLDEYFKDISNMESQLQTNPKNFNSYFSRRIGALMDKIGIKKKLLKILKNSYSLDGNFLKLGMELENELELPKTFSTWKLKFAENIVKKANSIKINKGLKNGFEIRLRRGIFNREQLEKILLELKNLAPKELEKISVGNDNEYFVVGKYYYYNRSSRWKI